MALRLLDLALFLQQEHRGSTVLGALCRSRALQLAPLSFCLFDYKKFCPRWIKVRLLVLIKSVLTGCGEAVG